MAAKKESDSKVTRIKASSSKPSSKTSTKTKTVSKSTVAKKPAETTQAAETKVSKKRSPIEAKGVAAKLLTPFTAFIRYIKGSWAELRQVHWPTRSATWGLTGAMLLFTAFFTLLILLLDAAFKYLFQLMIG